MKSFSSLSAPAIRAALSGVRRQYLVGDLKQPQKLGALFDNKIEVGISVYTAAAGEAPHRHARATEYQYVLKGLTEYRDLDTGETFTYKTGDFYVIAPGTAYAQRVKRDTEILFFKCPPGNDKEGLPTPPDLAAWLAEPLCVRRMDFSGAEAPAPNSLRPAAAVALCNDQNEVLLIRRADSGNWALPGGTMEYGESLTACAQREMREETGIDVDLIALVGTYTNPAHLIAYTDGEVRQEFTLLYLAKPQGGAVKLDSESTAFCWASFDKALALPMAESQKIRIRDLKAFHENGKTSFR